MHSCTALQSLALPAHDDKPKKRCDRIRQQLVAHSYVSVKKSVVTARFFTKFMSGLFHGTKDSSNNDARHVNSVMYTDHRLRVPTK